MTLVLPQNRVRLYFARGAGWAAGGGRRQEQGGGGRGAPRPSQPAASRTELGREADKAFPAPSPTAASPKGGGKRAGGGRARERRKGRRKVLPAGLGWIAPRREGREEGLAASENGEEGRILEGQDKQIVPLHVRGGGGGAGGGARRAASPLPLPQAGSLSPSAGRSARR